MITNHDRLGFEFAMLRPVVCKKCLLRPALPLSRLQHLATYFYNLLCHSARSRPSRDLSRERRVVGSSCFYFESGHSLPYLFLEPGLLSTNLELPSLDLRVCGQYGALRTVFKKHLRSTSRKASRHQRLALQQARKLQMGKRWLALRHDSLTYSNCGYFVAAEQNALQIDRNGWLCHGSLQGDGRWEPGVNCHCFPLLAWLWISAHPASATVMT